MEQFSLITGDVTAAVSKLKGEEGKDLIIYGHGLLGQTLLERHLLDELKLWIHPLLLGRGQLLFRQGDKGKLKLISAKTLGTGVVVATYQPLRS